MKTERPRHRLHSLLGSIEIESHLTVLADESASTHEHYHYLQLISTPFGIHIANLAWCKIFGLFHHVHEYSKEGHLRLPVPITELGTTMPPELTRALYSFGQVECYKEILLGKPSVRLDDAGQFVEENLSAVHEYCRAAVAAAGGAPTKQLPVVRRFSEAEILPRIGNLTITGRMVLENGAYAATAGAATGSIDDWLDGVQKVAPPAHCVLLRHLQGCTESSATALGFRFSCVQILDLCLFGNLPFPFLEGEVDWRRDHPAWRFLSCLNVLLRKTHIRKLVFNEFEDKCILGINMLCEVLSWPKPADITERILRGGLAKHLNAPFNYFTKTSSDALQLRLEQGRALCPVLEGYRGLLHAINLFDPDSMEPGQWEEFASSHISNSSVSASITVPATVDAMGVHLGEQDAFEYCRMMYYASLWASAIATGGDLLTPAALCSREQERVYFRHLTGFDFENVQFLRPIPHI